MEKYINYELDDRTVQIPRADLERYMSLPDVKTEDDACWIWCEDNPQKSGIINEEQERLTQKAKANRITATIHQARKEPTTVRKKVERKPDETKESIIATLAETLQQMVENVTIINAGKLIEFDFKEEHYKLDLIRQRKPKK